ncbi:MAG: protein-glutamine gamma-glutamyltransferase [Solirubrobacterales bacterium]|jgi:MYXO-CTERM domain-containing protein|nr:protein-glutamine gamma-glutamyltransferase [Solirubrobacterales bacterium]
MSGAAIPAGRPLAPARGVARTTVTARPVGDERAPRPALVIELPLFAALAALGMAQWARLVSPSSAGDVAAALGVICVAAVLSWALWFVPGRRLTMFLALGLALAAGLGALLVAGLPLNLLAPARWGQLHDRIQEGIGGIEQTQLPYSGTDLWVRLALVLGAPALVALAGTLAFWPVKRSRAGVRAVALGLLLTAYGVGATLDNPGAEAFWGIVLLVLSVAWLWAPGLASGRRAPAVAVAVAAGVLSLPLVARLNGPAWWDYQSWSWFGAQPTVTFQWDHDYGPLDWPRDGTTLMTVDTTRPLYWKASVLDRFDGYRWQRAATGDPAASAELRARGAIPGSRLEQLHPGWVTDATFEVRALSSDLVIGAGITDAVEGVQGTLESPDGTLTAAGEPLARGDKYSIISYVPQPTTDQLRRAPAPRSTRRFGGSTLLGIPGPAAETDSGTPRLATSMPLWGTSDAQTTSLLLASPYADTYRLALDWTAGARTPYDAVRAIEGHLRRDFGYTPSVPEHLYPLQAFLFSDRAGYCQQFAGTMGLMLRMLGIPARVVSGFAPGSLDDVSGNYEVHDFDAHSWVEVYFRGIGWVTFDPTPNAAPAESQRLGGDFATAFRGPAPNPTGQQATGGDPGQPGKTSEPAVTAPAAGGSAWPVVEIVIGTLALALAGLIAVVSWRRRRRLLEGVAVEDQIDELRAALGRLGWRLGPGTTLLGIERRATGVARVGIRRYVAALRAHRYAPGSAPPPGPAERRALRRALSGGGPLSRLRALVSVPPGGPARS